MLYCAALHCTALCCAGGAGLTLRPLARLPHTLGDVWRRALDENVEHDRGGEREAVPCVVPSQSLCLMLQSQEEGLGVAHQVKMYCMWLFLMLTSAALAIGIPFAAWSMAAI